MEDGRGAHRPGCGDVAAGNARRTEPAHFGEAHLVEGARRIVSVQELDQSLHLVGDAAFHDTEGLLHELHESHAIARIFARLNESGIDTTIFHSMDTPLFELVEGEGEKRQATPLFAIPEILTRILEISSKGVQIKRFKGLGEMNAKQLFETTMDPVVRQFLRVRLDEDNAVEADKMFDVLMGDIVEPRKRFIEDNALNVRNLDV